MLHVKLVALASICLLVSTAFANNLDQEQLSRLKELKNRARNHQTTIGDMHEGGAHYRILAARNRDSGLEPKLDAYLRNTKNEANLIAMCLHSGRQGVTQESCKAGLRMLRVYGSHTVMQAVASVSYNADKWGSFVPTLYRGDARYLPVILPNCTGVRQAIDVSFILSGAIAFVPGVDAFVSPVAFMFSGFLLYAADTWC